MKKLILLSLLLKICVLSNSQEYIRLCDGTILRGGNADTLKRTVEQVEKGILVTYLFDSVSMESDPLFTSAKLLRFNGFSIRSGIGKPALPINWDRFFVPACQYKVYVVDTTYIELPMEISPTRPSLQNGASPEPSKEKVKGIFPYFGYYPIDVVSSKCSKYKSEDILDICITPVQYNYTRKMTRIYKKISYLIDYKSAIQNENNNFLSTNSEDNSFLINISTRTGESFSQNVLKSTSVQITPPGYLILSVPQYSDAVNAIADWKRTLGYDVRVICKTDWDETSVKDSIVAANDSTPLDYLLLLGDYEDIPGKICVDTVGYDHYTYCSDYHYGCIQQDEYPEIHRGRLPVSSATEAQTVVDKIILYEREPIIDSLFYKKGLHCAYFQDDYHYNNQWQLYLSGDSVEDDRYTLTSEEIRNYLVDIQRKQIDRVYYADSEVTPFYWNNYRLGYYGRKVSIPAELRRSNNFSWDGNQTKIIESINTGAFYVLHRDHGTKLYWYKPYLGFSGIELLSNGQKLPVVFSMNCLTGRYNEGTCFSEKLLKKDNGGCVAIFAASENSITGFNDALTLGMFDAIWPQPGFVIPFPNMGNNHVITLSTTPSYRLGDIMDVGLANLRSIYRNYDDEALFHTKRIYHCFGDPAMEMFTETPTPFDSLSIHRNDQMISISLSEKAKITFYNLSSGLIESYKGFSVSYPYSDSLRISISAHNKIPVILEGNTLCIQNTAIENTLFYEADKIKVGANVTNMKTSGEVRLVGGKTRLKGKNIEIYNGTTVELGAELELTN